MRCYTDTETNGLDDRIHQAWELTYWREDAEQPVTVQLKHTLEHADPKALEINGYFDRVNAGMQLHPHTIGARSIAFDLTGVTLVGSNPDFDARMIRRFLGYQPWHHRTVNVATMAMVVFDIDEPPGLAWVRDRLVDHGFEIPAPDHTSEGDVRTTRAVFEALRKLRQSFYLGG